MLKKPIELDIKAKKGLIAKSKGSLLTKILNLALYELHKQVATKL